MSRSRKKPVIKDCPRNYKKSSNYWRTIRRVTKDKVRFSQENLDDELVPDPKEIINDYDYSDYRFDLRFRNDDFSEKKSRK
jgi:hypothetical protein